MNWTGFKVALLCVVLTGAFLPATAGRARAGNDTAASSKEMEARLKSLLVRYTEDHPDVQRLRRLLERVRKKEARERARKASEKNESSARQVLEVDPTEKQATKKPGNN